MQQSAPERLIGNATLQSSIRALLVKRYHLYKRDKTAICCEVIVPFICVVIGCMLNGIDFTQKSYTIVVEPDLYPTPQRILYNSDLVINTDPAMTTPDVFYYNLPQQSSW